MRLPEGKTGSCLSRIQSTAATGRNSAAAISRFVLTQPEEALRLTLAELAAKVGTSVASISRFCTLLGYENYRAFQIDLTASVAGSASPISDFFSPSDDPSTVIRRVFELNRQGLADTESLLTHDEVITVARMIMRARKLYIMGIGSAGLSARFGAIRMASLGITAVAITDPYEGLLTLSSASDSDVLIAVSHSGRSAVVVELLALARKKGAKSVGITNYADSLLAQRCEYVLLTSFRERRVNAAVSSSSIAQMCVLDTIYFLIAHFLGPKADKLAQEIENNAEVMLRTK